MTDDARHRLPLLLAEPFEPELARASTLSAGWYTDEGLYALERDRIFARTWQPVGRAAQVAGPGDFFTAEVAGRPVVVLRDEGNELRAFFNVCRHRAGPVARGCGRRKSLQCAYHGWTYRLDGSLATTPDFDGVECFDRDAVTLERVAVAAWGPFVFVNLDGTAPPLLDFLGGIVPATKSYAMETLTFRETREWTIACNWKVYMDNYHEGYHVPLVHPGLFRAIDFSKYRTTLFDNYEQQDAPIKPSESRSGERPYQGREGEALYYGVFPNWMLNVYPGNVSINIVLPAGVDRTRTVFDWYFDSAMTPEAIAKAIAFSEEVQDEDIRICEDVQKGLTSGVYTRGRFSVKREAAVHHFQQLVHRYVTRA